MLCCVTPMAYRMQTPSASTIMCATFSRCPRKAAGPRGKLHREWCKAFFVFVESVHHSFRNLVRPYVVQQIAVTAESQTRSVPGLGCRKRSATLRHFCARANRNDELLPAQLVPRLR